MAEPLWRPAPDSWTVRPDAVATTRNWRSVTNLAELAASLAS